MQVTHVISGLGVGGTERMLLKIVEATQAGADHSVIVLSDEMALASELEALGVPVTGLEMDRNLPRPTKLLSLGRELRRLDPDIIQTWMYHADLLGGLAGRAATNAPVLWNVRQSNLGASVNSRRTLLVARACSSIARWAPARVITNSEAAKIAHERIGYPGDRFTIIPNGFDLDRFAPDPNTRQELRASLGIPAQAPVVGWVGRHHPVKDPGTFIQAAVDLMEDLPELHVIMCGSGITPDNLPAARGLPERLAGRFHLVGPRDDVPSLMNGFDVMASSSRGEGLPNVVGEAMATGLTCVATDVGDVADLLGGLGELVPPEDPVAMAEAIRELLRTPADKRTEIGRRGRKRIRDSYSIEAAGDRYLSLYQEFL